LQSPQSQSSHYFAKVGNPEGFQVPKGPHKTNQRFGLCATRLFCSSRLSVTPGALLARDYSVRLLRKLCA